MTSWALSRGWQRSKIELSLLAYAVSIALAFVLPAIAITQFVVAALMWLVLDQRIESVLKE
jgi:hypothetical protein